MSNPEPASPSANNGKRRRILLVLAGVFALGGIAWGAWWMLHGRYHESTDDAYVAGEVVQITPQVAGTVVAIRADDTDYVKAGSPLVELDTADSRVALRQAEAQLAQAVRETRALFANDGALASALAQREADLARARDDLARRKPLAGTGAVTAEDINHAAMAVKSAEAAVATAREQLAAGRALTAGAEVERNPNVLRAAARVEELWLAWARASIPAPVSGVVARRSVQAGQRVGPGTPLMAVVPLDQVWVDANFKEVQLRHMRIGQPAELTADVYGSRVIYHGRVVGLGAGTGAAFALLPAQNATGNWIKVVQRVPVRISLDAKELAEHPLRVGLSVLADVDIHEQGGPALTEARRIWPAASTAVFAGQARIAHERAARIIAAVLRGEDIPPLIDDAAAAGGAPR